MVHAAAGSGTSASHRALAAVVLVPLVVVLASVVLAGVLVGAPLDAAIEDPTATLGGHPLTGVASIVGVLAWWSTATICLFAWALIRGRSGEPGLPAFLLWAGLLTAWLAIDDQFLVHEDLGARYLGLGQRHFLVAYAVILGLTFLAFRRQIMRPGWPFLAASLVLMGASVATDYLHEKVLYPQTGGEGVALVTFAEDALKLLGIACWSIYLIGASLDAVAGATRTAREREHAQAQQPRRLIEVDEPRLVSAEQGRGILRR